MEASEITHVLVSASELQLKFEAALRRAARPLLTFSPPHVQEDCDNGEEEGEADDYDIYQKEAPHAQSTVEAHRLRAILDALLHLQDHLRSLQALYKQQNLERDHFLIELEERRKDLIRSVKEYNGMEWELVQEAHAFAGVPVQGKDDLMLPPYQSHDMVGGLEFGHTGDVNSSAKHSAVPAARSRRSSMASRLDAKSAYNQSSQKPEGSLKQNGTNTTRESRSISSFVAGFARRAGKAIGISAKTALVLASVISVLALSHVEPHVRKWAAERSKKLQVHNRDVTKTKLNRSLPLSNHLGGPIIEDHSCPPGKVLLMQDGVQKCFVKERVEAPFKDVIKQPDASYGYG